MDQSELHRYVREAFRQMNGQASHPTVEQLTALVQNTIAGPERAQVESHLSGCAPCRTQLEELQDFLRECQSPPDPGVAPQWPEFAQRVRRRRVVMMTRRWGSIAAAIFAVLGLSWFGVRALRKPPEQLLAVAYQERRPFDLRLGPAAYAPIRAERSGGSSFALPPSLLDAQARLARDLQSKPDDPELLRLRARAELLQRQSAAAVQTLERCLQFQPRNALVLAELGAAYALRGDEERQPADWASALEYLSQAIQIRAAVPEWVFNQALVLERMQQLDQAVERWQEYLRLDPAGGWSDEARRHLLALQERLKSRGGALRRDAATPEEFLSGGAQNGGPEGYLIRAAISHWLPRAAVHEPSRRALAALAITLETRNGDLWLRDMLRENTPEGVLRQLAEARAANQAGDAQRALSAAAAAQRAWRGPRDAPAMLWARFEEAVGLHNLMRSGECFSTAEKLESDLAPRPYPWLLARVRIERAICAMRLGRLNDAAPLLRLAMDAGRAADFPETVLRAGSMYLDCIRFTGLTSEIFANADQMLRTFWSGDFPDMQYQQIVDRLRLTAAAEGQRHTALFLARSALWAALRSSNVLVQAPAQAQLAVAAQAAGEPDEARQHLEAGDRLLADLAPAYRVEPQLAFAELELDRGGQGAALARLEALRAGMAERVTASIEVKYHALLGEALRRTASPVRAAAEFRLAISKGSRQIASLSSERERAGLLRVMEDSTRGLVALELAASRPAGSLAEWKALRALDALGKADAPRHSVGPLLWCVELTDQYACWLDRPNAVPAFHRLDPPKETVAAAIRRLQVACADPQSDSARLRADARQIYEWLVKPFDAGLAAGQTLTVDLDGNLASIPVEALISPEGEYLAERFALVVSSGYAELAPPENLSPAAHVLVIANPAVAGAAVAQFPSLPESLREAAAVRAAFPAAESIEGRAASMGAVTEALPRADVVHFAGHAYSNAQGPALILAPRDSKLMDYELLRSPDLRRQDWSRCKLAVLSACATAAGRSRGAVNPASLVRAITRSAAARVVASLWNVDSAATAEFMSGFYGSLAQGSTPVAALRAAQRGVRRHPEWAHPYYWAAFQLYGTI